MQGSITEGWKYLGESRFYEASLITLTVFMFNKKWLLIQILA